MEAKSPRILIVRLSAIGDVIHTMPVACAVREHFPRAFLAWVVEERAAALLRGHEAIDEMIALPRGWLKSPRCVWRLRRRLRDLRVRRGLGSPRFDQGGDCGLAFRRTQADRVRASLGPGTDAMDEQRTCRYARASRGRSQLATFASAGHPLAECPLHGARACGRPPDR